MSDPAWDPASDTYEEWVPWIKKSWNNQYMWQRVDNWFFPSPQNTTPMHQSQFYHICKDNWLLGRDPKERHQVRSGRDSCPACGALVPDNIKMIAMLLSW